MKDKFIKVKGTMDKTFKLINLKYIIDLRKSHVRDKYYICINDAHSILTFKNEEDRDAYFDKITSLLNVIEI